MRHWILTIGLVTVAACSEIPQEAYYNRGAPEPLLDVSSEVVNLSVGTDQGLEELSQWVNKDQPTRAELYCQQGDAKCSQAQNVLNLYGVSTNYVPSPNSTVTLVYERVIARDCDQRYVDNHINPYNWNHPAFGCANAGNIVQMVSDKQQFVSPAMLGDFDGGKAAQVHDLYMSPPVSLQPTGVRNNLSSSARAD